MEQLRIPELELPASALGGTESTHDGSGPTVPVARMRRAGAKRRSGRVDWRLDPGLRRLGRRKVHEARRLLDEARQSHLAEAS